MGISEQAVQNNKKQRNKQTHPKVVNLNPRNHRHWIGKIIKDSDKNPYVIIFTNTILTDSVGEIAHKNKATISNRELQVGVSEWEVDEEKLRQSIKTVCIKVWPVLDLNASHDLKSALIRKILTPIYYYIFFTQQ